ncbi:MAG: hypothetical protein QM831_02675 [Kofleriaceae bacterium]
MPRALATIVRSRYKSGPISADFAGTWAAKRGAVAIEKGVGNVDLVVGIVEDTRELVSANVDLLRGEISTKLSVLGSTLGQLLIGIGVFVVTAILLCLAIAASVIALGVPVWVALWGVCILAAAIGHTFIKKARATAKELLGESK